MQLFHALGSDWDVTAMMRINFFAEHLRSLGRTSARQTTSSSGLTSVHFHFINDRHPLSPSHLSTLFNVSFRFSLMQ